MMKFSRDLTTVINYILDNLCPPILRDCYPLMYPIYRIAYGKATAKLLRYKDHYAGLNEEEYSAYYALAASTRLSARPTDLNRISAQFIFSSAIAGGPVLDAGCGRGWLAEQLAARGFSVTGLDIDPPPSAPEGYSFVQGSLESMPFEDGAFDTVVCSHVLEHVRRLDRAVAELLRVAGKRVVIVLPRQREYRYVADLHIRYFPYLYDVQMAIPVKSARIARVGADWGVLIEKEAAE